MSILRKQFLEHVGQTSPSPLMVEVERAEGVYFYSPDGKAYMDLISGVSVSNVGHNNPKVVKAICAQARSYTHVMVYGELLEKPQIQYATMICDTLPESLDSVYFLNSGAEAIEGAMKLAKRATSRTEIISMKGAYHGSTQGAMSIMGDEFFKTAFRPLLPDTRQIRFNETADLELITTRTACVVTEVVQGESGVNPARKEYIEALRKRCNEVGALLIFDEIQTAFGRTGRWFAFEHYGVAPDILVLAKALGGGMPLGAFVSSREMMGLLTENPVLGHISTFGGHPVCCAAGKAAMEFIAANDLMKNAVEMGELFYQELRNAPNVVEIRRSGLLLAVELGSSEKLYSVMGKLLQAGYMSDWFLFCDTAFRISPPLTISREEVLKCCADIIKVLKTA